MNVRRICLFALSVQLGLLNTVLLTESHVLADEGVRNLIVFEDPEAAAKQWQAVNDGVMGGRSEGQFRIIDSGYLEFFGNLSLANNGGFASIRTRASKLGLETGDTLVAKIRGDGRTYTFNLYVPTRSVAFSYRTDFKTTKDEWIEVELPLRDFEATSFGRKVRNQPLDPSDVSAIGILLGDKKQGPFKLDLAWIKVKSKTEQ